MDAQFEEKMGSPYLLAHGIDVPVEDAATTVTIPEAGEYRVWVRAKDYSDLNGQIGRVSCCCGRGPYENMSKSHFREYGQWLDSYVKGEEIRDYLMRAIIGTDSNVRNKDSEKYVNLKLAHLTFVAATGGCRRYVGDYILTEEDIRNHAPFSDAVAVNSGAFCLHYPGNPSS